MSRGCHAPGTTGGKRFSVARLMTRVTPAEAVICSLVTSTTKDGSSRACSHENKVELFPILLDKTSRSTSLLRRRIYW
jgi:hypothetical protein